MANFRQSPLDRYYPVSSLALEYMLLTPCYPGSSEGRRSGILPRSTNRVGVVRGWKPLLRPGSDSRVNGGRLQRRGRSGILPRLANWAGVVRGWKPLLRAGSDSRVDGSCANYCAARSAIISRMGRSDARSESSFASRIEIW